MKLRTFRAPSMAQALAQVKRQLGTDAVIVHTRTFKTGGVFGFGAKPIVEITARKGEPKAVRPRQAGNDRLKRLYSTPVEPASQQPSSGLTKESMASLQRLLNSRMQEERPNPAPAQMPAIINDENKQNPLADPHLKRQQEQIQSEISAIRGMVENLVKEQRQLHEPQMPEQLFDMYLDLIQREVTEEIARDMIGKIQKGITGNQAMSSDVVRQKLVQIMDSMINTTGPITPNINGKARVVALIGPTGVGKTTTIAKIAANMKLRQNKKVGLITIDTYRIGAIDQLRMYAQIIDVPLKVVLTPTELGEAVRAMEDYDIVLIDTAGRCQNDELKIKELKTFMESAQPDEIHLVLSGNSHRSHMLSAAEKFKPIGVDRIILTKVDEAISFGVVLSVLEKIDASISYVTTGQDVPDDIEIGSGRKLAQRLLGIDDAALAAMDFSRSQIIAS